MGVIKTAADWLRNLFSKDVGYSVSDAYNVLLDTCYKEFALQKVANLIAATMSSAKFKTYLKGKSVKKDLYYLLNVRPNINHSASDLWSNVIYKLIREQKALVIQVNDNFHLADNFTEDKYAFLEWTFKNIIIDDFELSKSFKMKDVLYFTFNNSKIKNVVESIDRNYSTLNEMCKNAYLKDKITKVLVRMETTSSLKKEEDKENKTLDNMVKDAIKPFVEGTSSILTLPMGFDIKEFDVKKSGTSIDEIIKSGKEIVSDIASLFNIPEDIFSGDKAEIGELQDIYISNAFKPFKRAFEDELNGKLYTRKEYAEGNYIKLDDSHLKYKDIFEIADGVDKLGRNGFTHNFIREKMDEDKSDDVWADKAYITKNNAFIEDS